MATNKCNKCHHQAVVKFESHNKSFCLVLDIPLEESVKNCTEFVDAGQLKEPELFEEELESVLEKPSKRKINKLIKQITQLRQWGKQNNKPKMKRNEKKNNDNDDTSNNTGRKRKSTTRTRQSASRRSSRNNN